MGMEALPAHLGMNGDCLPHKLSACFQVVTLTVISVPVAVSGLSFGPL